MCILYDIYKTLYDLIYDFFSQNSVSPDAFHAIYEWMIFSGADSNKILKRDNVLDLFCAAQFLCIKGMLRYLLSNTY